MTGKPEAKKKGGELEISPREAKVVFGTVCFLAGASLMVIEMTGNRLLAPVFGNSLYTWTALIGVVLVAFSAGTYFGGWLVDRSPRPAVLGVVLLAAAIATLLIPPVYYLVDGVVARMDLLAGPMTLSIILFMVPGCLLGSVTPFTIRLLSMADEDQHIGRAAGIIGMLGTLGSVVGTLGSGFFLIPMFGARHIFIFTAFILLLSAGLIFWRFKGLPKGAKAIMLGVIVLSSSLSLMVAEGTRVGSVFKKLTFYHQIEVYDQEYRPGQAVRYLQLDTTTEGGQVRESGDIVVEYQHYWMLARPLGENLKRAAFLGAGAFAMPQHLARQWPGATVDVVEIDPEVIQVGYDYFKLGDYENVEAHAMDARRFLATSEGDYDLIFGDAYNGVRYIPAHLTTVEFFETVRGALSEDGVFMMNIISGLTGPRAELFNAIHATVAAVFENVEVFSSSPSNFVVPHNIILTASERELDSFYRKLPEGLPREVHELAATRVDPTVFGKGREVVLTDDKNPVEWIVARQLKLE